MTRNPNIKLAAVIATAMILLTLIAWQADANAALPVYKGGCVKVIGNNYGQPYGTFEDWVSASGVDWAYWRVVDYNRGPWYGPWIQMSRQAWPWWVGSGSYTFNYYIDLQAALGNKSGWTYHKISPYGIDPFIATAQICG